jgi:hypothetical protein
MRPCRTDRPITQPHQAAAALEYAVGIGALAVESISTVFDTINHPLPITKDSPPL